MKYTQVIFDSPMGIDSVTAIKALGFNATWEGNPGCRGITTWYWPRRHNLNIKSAEEVRQTIEMMCRLDKDHPLEGIFDQYTKITVLN